MEGFRLKSGSPEAARLRRKAASKIPTAKGAVQMDGSPAAMADNNSIKKTGARRGLKKWKPRSTRRLSGANRRRSMQIQSQTTAADPAQLANSSSTSQTPSVPNIDGLANENTFLQLLVAQIKNQDPLQPADSIQFLSQLAQFSQLEQLIGIRQELQTNSSQNTSSTSSNSSGNSSGGQNGGTAGTTGTTN